MPSYDLLIRGGTVIDPSVNLHGPRDVASADGRIAALEQSIPDEQTARAIDARGKLVVPGLIDLHAHVFSGVGEDVDPDQVCLPRGTTTAVDGGTAGSRSFDGLKRYVVDRSHARVRAWLNISSIGLIDTRVGELVNLNYVDVESAVQPPKPIPTQSSDSRFASLATSPARRSTQPLS
jgi:dihydroorotase